MSDNCDYCDKILSAAMDNAFGEMTASRAKAGENTLQKTMDEVRAIQKKEAEAATEAAQIAQQKKLEALKTNTLDPKKMDPIKGRFYTSLQGANAKAYIGNMDTTTYSAFRDEVRSMFGGEVAREVEQTYKAERISQIEGGLAKMRQAGIDTSQAEVMANKIRAIDLSRGEGILQRYDLDLIDQADTWIDMQGSTAVAKTRLNKIDNEISRKSGSARGEGSPLLEQEKITINKAFEDQFKTENAKNLIKDENVPAKTRQQLTDELAAGRINDQTIARAQRQAKAVEEYDIKKLTSKNFPTEYNKIKTSMDGGEDVANEIVAKSIRKDITEFDKTAKQPKDLAKIVNNIRMGKETPADAQVMKQVMNQIDAGTMRRALGLVEPVNRIGGLQGTGIGKALTTKKLLGVGAILGTGYFLLIEVPNQYLYRSMQEQKAWEAIAQLAGIKADQMSVENIHTTFFSTNAENAQNTFFSAQKDMIDFYNWVTGLPIIGAYYKAVMATPTANMVGQDINKDNVMTVLKDRGLVIEDESSPMGWRETREDEREKIFYNDPTILIANNRGDAKYVASEAGKMWGNEDVTLSDGSTAKQWQLALYYRSKDEAGGLGIGIDTLGSGMGNLAKRLENNPALDLEATTKGKELDDSASKRMAGSAKAQTTSSGTGTITQDQRDSLHALGLSDAQIAYNLKGGNLPVPDGKGGWKFNQMTTEQQARAGPGGAGPAGGGASSGAETGELTPAQQTQANYAKQSGGLGQETYTEQQQAIKPFINNGAYDRAKAKDALGATEDDLYAANQKVYAKTIANDLATPDKVKSVSGEDLRSMNRLDATTTGKTLAAAYTTCTG